MYDKTGREIRIGDTLKIFHFIGRRRKKYYMYKYVQKLKQFDTCTMFIVNHLSVKNTTYNLINDDKIHPEIEIVQGYNNKNKELSFEDRPRISLTPTK